MKTANFLINKPKSIKQLYKFLQKYPQVILRGEILELSTITKDQIVFKDVKGGIQFLSFSPGQTEKEWGIDFFQNRFIYTVGNYTRSFYYE